MVVLDSCTDQSCSIVQRYGVSWIECNYACVGKARDLGIRQLIQNGATWLACTDADSVVSLTGYAARFCINLQMQFVAL